LSTRRTLRKPTRWTPEEWAQIEESARRCGVPPARYVREAALGRTPPERSHPVPRATDDRVRGNTLLNQLSRVLSNLRQLTRVAEIDGDTAASEVLAASTRTVEDAAVRAPTAIDQDADTALAIEEFPILGPERRRSCQYCSFLALCEPELART
jgi:hypothetical protein